MFGMFTPLMLQQLGGAAAPLLLASCVGLSACTAEDSAGTPVDGNEPAALTAIEIAPIETTIAGGNSRNVMIVFSECTVPDPAIDESYASRGIGAHSLVTEIHAGLTRIDEDAGNDVAPDLAESYVARDGDKVYEFTLRKGLKFSDGSELTAADVKWSWERSLKLSRTWTHARDAFASIIGADRVVLGHADEIEGLEVVDDLTLIVNLSEPVPLFPMLIAGPAGAVLKPENVRSWPVRWTNGTLIRSASPPIDYQYHEIGMSDFTPESMVVGAGPFSLMEYHADYPFADCSIRRNAHYWGPPAKLDAVVFSPNPGGTSGSISPGHVTSWFTDAAVDFIPPVSDSQAEELMESHRATIAEFAPQPYTFFLVFNPAVQPLDDTRFRRALIHAADPEAFGGDTDWDPVIVPPRLVEYPRSVSGPTADATLAQSELGESRYASDSTWPGFEMYTDGAGGWSSRLENLFSHWSETLSISAEFKYIETFDEYQSFIDGAEVAIRSFAIEPIYPDPYAVLAVFDGPFGSAGGAASSDHEVVNLLHRARSEGDPSVRRELYDQLEQHILDEALALPLSVKRPGPRVLVQPWVRGLNLKRFGGSVFHNVWFDDTAPERPLP